MKTRILWTAFVVLLTGVVLAGGAAGKGSPAPTSKVGPTDVTESVALAAKPAATRAANRTRTALRPVLHSHSRGVHSARPSRAPSSPAAVLYDQYNNAGISTDDITSQNFQAAFDQFDSETADDFVVPARQLWTVTTVDVQGDYSTAGPADSFNVVFYANNGTLPGIDVAARASMAYTNSGGSGGDFTITLSPAVTLGSGTYWVGVQANQDSSVAGQWFWRNRTVQANQGAAWRNPGNGFGTGCTSFTLKTTCIGAQGPDQVFKLSGNSSTWDPNHTGSLSGADPTITDPNGRIFRAEPPSTCATPHAFPGYAGGAATYHYHTHTIRNASASAACVTVNVDPRTTCNGSASFISVSAYLNSFNPANIQQNYLADIGGSPQTPKTFSFALPAGAKAVIVVSEVTANSGCAGYEVTTNEPTPAPAYAQTFDGVAAPALPAGWTATNAAGPAPTWTTSSSGLPAPPAYSAPNAAFVDDPNVVSDKQLLSPTFAIRTTSAQLSFRQNRDLESGYDGGVLEISIDGGAFQDITAAGGSFEARGYNGTISACCTNPLAGRSAWTGSSGGFDNTIVNLPAAAAGHSVRLRWRMGSDFSVSHAGWRIDSILLKDGQHVTVAKAGTGSGTVTSSPAGISCGATCSATYEIGSSVTLSPAAATGSTFAGWSGACSGTGACTVVANAAKSVTATFTLQRFALNVTKSGRGTVTSAPAGIACGATCSAAFNYGTSVVLTASPTSTTKFMGWSGDCSGTGTCTLSMTANHAATATFKAKCVVPKVVGKTLKKAKALIKKRHCRVGKITRKFSTKKKKGRVLKQSPKPGKKLAPSAKVKLIVGKGPKKK
jgi:hypothetical protein